MKEKCINGIKSDIALEIVTWIMKVMKWYILTWGLFILRILQYYQHISVSFFLT